MTKIGRARAKNAAKIGRAKGPSGVRARKNEAKMTRSARERARQPREMAGTSRGQTDGQTHVKGLSFYIHRDSPLSGSCLYGMHCISLTLWVTSKFNTPEQNSVRKCDQGHTSPAVDVAKFH